MNRIGLLVTKTACEERNLDFFSLTEKELNEVFEDHSEKLCSETRKKVSKMSKEEKDELTKRAMSIIEEGKNLDQKALDKINFLSEKPNKSWDLLTLQERKDFLKE